MKIYFNSKNINKWVLLLLMVAITHSCIEIKGLSSGYEKNKELVKVEFVDDISNSGNFDKTKIYAVNATTLQQKLKMYDQSLLYKWSPHCTSDVCISPKFLQEYCDANNIELFVMLDYYDVAVNDFTETTEHPIFITDHFYYKTNFANKYNNRFVADITDMEYDRKNQVFWDRFLFFEKGEFVKSETKVL